MKGAQPRCSPCVTGGSSPLGAFVCAANDGQSSVAAPPACRSLPDGPYLDSLHTLMLGGNNLWRVPPVLRRATNLQVTFAGPLWKGSGMLAK